MVGQYEFYSPDVPDAVRRKLTRRVEEENAGLASWRAAESQSESWKGQIKLDWREEKFMLRYSEQIKSSGSCVGSDTYTGIRGGKLFTGASLFARVGMRREVLFGNPFQGVLIPVPGGGTVIQGRFVLSWAARLSTWGVLLLCLGIGWWMDAPLAFLGALLCMYQIIRGEVRADQCHGSEGLLQMLKEVAQGREGDTAGGTGV